MTPTKPATALDRAVPLVADPAAQPLGDPLLPDADEGDAHRPGDSVGVPAPPAASRPTRFRTAP